MSNKMRKTTAKIVHFKGGLRTTIPAQLAMPGPPLGTQLGQLGANIANFVKDFNLKTSIFREGVPLPTRTTINADRSYNLTIHHPTSTFLLKQAAGVSRGAMEHRKEIVGYLTRKHIYEIAVIKSQDPPLQMVDLKDICNDLIDTAFTIGIHVVDELNPAEYQKFLENRKLVIAEQLDEIKAAKEAKLLRTA
ncbi:39S ribosomal protein L11, mitochondrial-like [Eurytemora carolleeae]|uniref:39S ribosomal protein L11, mitochondrial-like n=1 Tax=Eurytemora carolleeae TaxID=1294199 RepID=UPI000C75C973|nr:39S ribosomal protein L11, mitochondrial-like [Eurytemora carolleeae]|eukprot:XP_023334121.1 39S ribosomal protein L11, mitochondrial-like [Eurytemora affinis]